VLCEERVCGFFTLKLFSCIINVVQQGFNFINILLAHFLPIFWPKKIAKPNVIREKLLNLFSNEKPVHKMLMKFTLGTLGISSKQTGTQFTLRFVDDQ